MLRRILLCPVALTLALCMSNAAIADEKDLGAGAVKLTVEELDAAYNDSRHEGMYVDDGRWYFFKEHYKSDGTISGSGGPRNNKNKWNWTGEWAIEDDRICFRYEGSSGCRDIYLDEGIYKSVDGGEVMTWWEFSN